MKGCIFGIPQRMLPELKNPGEVLGTISDEIAEMCHLPKNIKVIGTGSDKGNETVGLGALNKDIAAISYGTACSIEIPRQKYSDAEPFLPFFRGER